MEGGDDMTNQHQRVVRWVATAGLFGTLFLGGCASKSVMVTTSGAAPSSPAVQTHAKAGPGATAPISQNPSGSEALQGFSKTPVEEQVTQPGPMVVAKAEQPESQARKASEAVTKPLADIYFAFDRWGLSAEGRKYLTEDAETLKQHPEATLLIEGYCDERGSREYNLVLGEKRAQEAMLYLSALGIKNPVKVTSYGKERQVCTEQDEACFWKNRRAHLVIEGGK
jgi:peptidoglycan-associated lipoprotein